MADQPLLVFAPGAGAPSSHPWMQRWAERLRAVGEVVLFDYSYMLAGSRRPDRLPVLLGAHREALQRARAEHSAPAFIVGKSMGGRIGCHVSLEEAVRGLICFGYPLRGGDDPTKLRDKVLRELTTPVLFIQGTRDPLCPLELLQQVRAEMRAPNELHVVEAGDHSLLVSKTQLKLAGETQEEVDARILRAIATFVAQHSG